MRKYLLHIEVGEWTAWTWDNVDNEHEDRYNDGNEVSFFHKNSSKR
jgi:hypothetical protein